MKNIINSNSQMHGKAFENMLKAVFNASDTKRLSTSKFDIEAKFNKDTNSPISIKTMKAETKSICMSDARRFFEETDSFTLEDVELFHEQLKKIEYGRHIEARDFAKSKLKELKIKHSLIILNPKIDSKFQRRLQCSLPIDKLEKVIGKENIKSMFHNC